MSLVVGDVQDAGAPTPAAPTGEVSPFAGVRVVSQGYPFGGGRFFAATDSAGRRYRLIAMPPGSGLPPLSPDRIARLREVPGIIRPLAYTRTQVAEYWLTEWPEGTDLVSLFDRPDLDVETKRALAVQICQIVESLGALEGISCDAINPAALFVDGRGALRLDGVGMDGLMASYQQQRLASRKRELADYAPRVSSGEGDSGAAWSEAVHSVGMVAFELFAGTLPRGSFFAMPSEKCSLDPRLDSALLTAVGRGREGESVSLGELRTAIQSAGYVSRSTSFAVQVPPDDDDELTPRKQKQHRMDGMFSWMPNWIAVVAIAAGALGAAAISFVHHERKKNEEMVLDIDPAMRLLDEAEQLFALEKRLEALQKIALVAEGAPISDEVMARMAAVMVKANEYEAFLEYGAEYKLRALRDGGPRADALLAVFAKFERKIGDYAKAMEIAKLVAGRQDMLAANAALRAALEVFPEDREARGLLAANPIEIQLAGRSALQRLKVENPGMKSMRWSMVAGYGELELDLSGNPDLQSILALEGQPTNALDLSGTGVRDLWPLETSPLRSLRVDRSKVRSLGPVVATPIVELSFARAQVRAVPFLETHPTLIRYRGHSGGKLKLKAAAPVRGRSWDNSLGQRFVPLPSSGAWFGRHEVRVADYRQFLDRVGHRGGAEALPVRSRGWSSDPKALEREEYPITGVSRLDAEAFCKWLTELEMDRGILTSGQRYRLPTDAEWSAAAGVAAAPYQDVRSRARESFGRRLKGVGRFRMFDAEGYFEPSGCFPLASVSESNLDAVGHLGPVGRFHSRGEVRDLATGVREWLHGNWADGDARGAVRGMSWRRWQKASSGKEVRDPLVQREALAASQRADDLGFRLVLEDVDSQGPPPIDVMIAEGRFAEAIEAARDVLVLGADADLRRAVSSMLAATRGGAGAETFRGVRYALVELPLSLPAAEKFCESVGGEFAEPHDEAERDWIKETFARPGSCGAVWLGKSDGDAGRLALPWPSREVQAPVSEQHVFVVRWPEE